MKNRLMLQFKLTEAQYRHTIQKIHRIHGYYLNEWIVEADFHKFLDAN